MLAFEAVPLFMLPDPLQLLSRLQLAPFTAAHRVASFAAWFTKW
jgi:hypothetical protein